MQPISLPQLGRRLLIAALLLSPALGHADAPANAGSPLDAGFDYTFGRPIAPGEHTYAWYRKTHADEAASRLGLDPKVVADGMDTWHWWTGVDNPGFYRDLAKLSGSKLNPTGLKADFFRVLLTVPRAERFAKLGLINDPDAVAAEGPDELGLTIDKMKDGTLTWDPEIFGYSSGVIGLQLFKNPKFNRAAWSVDKYLDNPGSVEPPFNVGMSCAFCHVGFDPHHPPENPNEPKWDNLTSAIGNQYLREGLIFGLNIPESSMIRQYLETQEPGTSETSRFPSDFINNPTNINSIFRLGERLNHKHVEAITPAQRDLIRSMYENAGLKTDNVGGTLMGTEAEPKIAVPHVLTDGADSMSVLMASTRVYVNEGMMHKLWYNAWPLNPFDLFGSLRRGFKPAEFDLIATARKDPNSPWMQTERRMPNMATFLTTYDSFPLQGAQDPSGGAGTDYLTADDATLQRGKLVFADNCAGCHSSKRPDPMPTDPVALKAAWRDVVLQDDFLVNNYLSDDKRYPVSELGTNAQRAEGTNAQAGSTWGQMSSQTYKDLRAKPMQLVDFDSQGQPIPLYNPITGQRDITWTGTTIGSARGTSVKTEPADPKQRGADNRKN